ncbi:MAG: hypothetical protein MJZ45_00130 [Bacteroidales bacterium]|nr:hypothetical protein [Bacteroidales bacterium]
MRAADGYFSAFGIALQPCTGGLQRQGAAAQAIKTDSAQNDKAAQPWAALP